MSDDTNFQALKEKYLLGIGTEEERAARHAEELIRRRDRVCPTWDLTARLMAQCYDNLRRAEQFAEEMVRWLLPDAITEPLLAGYAEELESLIGQAITVIGKMVDEIDPDDDGDLPGRLVDA